MDKKQRIMQAAEMLFTTRQFHEITLAEVARESDVGKGTIYLYFADKNDLFFQTAVSGFDEMCEMLLDKSGPGVPFSEELAGACEKISEFFGRRRSLFRMIQSEGDRALGHGGSLRQRWMERRKRLTLTVAGIIKRGVDSGKIRSEVPAEVLSEYLLGMLRARLVDMAELPEARKKLSSLVNLFINGSGAASRID